MNIDPNDQPEPTDAEIAETLENSELSAEDVDISDLLESLNN